MTALRSTLALALSVSLGQALQLGPQIFNRRGALAQAAALVITPLAIPLLPAHADVYGANSDLPTDNKGVNKFLQAQGFPALPNANGMSPLMKYIGTAAPANIDGQKVKARTFNEILLVRWNFPNGWLIISPDITENGEAGTLGANNFIKGDSEVRDRLPRPLMGPPPQGQITQAAAWRRPPRPPTPRILAPACAGVHLREAAGRQAAQGAGQGVLRPAALIADDLGRTPHHN